nr:MAG TPA: hypothetical protein [Caudoviricetes sp.]
MIKNIIKYAAIAVTVALLPVVFYIVTALIYKFYLFVAGIVTPESKEYAAFFGMLILAVVLAGCIVCAGFAYEIKTMK